MAWGLGMEDSGVSEERGLLTRQGLVSQDQAAPLPLHPGALSLQGQGELLALKQSRLQGLLLCSETQRWSGFSFVPLGVEGHKIQRSIMS